MTRVLAFLVPIVIAIYTVVDCIDTPEDEVRGLQKMIWVFVILLFPLVGSVAWWVAGRPKPIGRLPGPRLGPQQRSGPKRPIGPDDDPDFLRKL